MLTYHQSTHIHDHTNRQHKNSIHDNKVKRLLEERYLLINWKYQQIIYQHTKPINVAYIEFVILCQHPTGLNGSVDKYKVHTSYYDSHTVILT